MAMQDQTEARGDAGLQRIADLLGGSGVLRHTVKDAFDAHEMLLEGISGAALVHLVGHLANLPKSAAFEKAVGISLRTIQRRRDAPGKRLGQEQSGRTWKFAEVLAKATAVLGTQENAEHWLQQPAVGLDRRRPIDLLATPAGMEIVEDFLSRLEYGVYT